MGNLEKTLGFYKKKACQGNNQVQFIKTNDKHLMYNLLPNLLKMKIKLTIFFYIFSGNFCTVRKCVHRETGITYAAKFSSRKRMVNEKGVDCSMDILHEIAILSVCTDSNKIVHLKDVFQNRHEIILVLE